MNRPIIILIASVIFWSLNVNAHEGATGVVKERMTYMKGIKENMKSIKQMVTDNESYDSTRIKQNIAEARNVSSNVVKLFPPGSTQHPSEALPGIWESWQEFEQLFNKMDARLGLLEHALPEGNMRLIKTRLKDVSQTCKSCHDKFRKEK